MKTKTIRKNNKQGISLIVLVITIIVMVILAGAIILTLNNSGIIGKASEAVEETNLATIKEVAELAWAETYLEYREDSSVDIVERTKEKIKAQGYMVEGEGGEVTISGYKVTITTTGVEMATVEEEEGEYEGLTVTAETEGVTYYTVTIVYPDDTNDLSSPENTYTQVTDADTIARMQTTPQQGDCIRYKGAEYVYGYQWAGDTSAQPFFDSGENRWNITKLSSEELCGHIFGNPVVGMRGVGRWTSSLSTKNINIPNTITDMNGAFAYFSLEDTTIVIPSSVDNLSWTFSSPCTIIGATIVINANPTNYKGCFSGQDLEGGNVTITGTSNMLETLKGTSN